MRAAASEYATLRTSTPSRAIREALAKSRPVAPFSSAPSYEQAPGHAISALSGFASTPSYQPHSRRSPFTLRVSPRHQAHALPAPASRAFPPNPPIPTYSRNPSASHAERRAEFERFATAAEAALRGTQYEKVWNVVTPTTTGSGLPYPRLPASARPPLLPGAATGTSSNPAAIRPAPVPGYIGRSHAWAEQQYLLDEIRRDLARKDVTALTTQPTTMQVEGKRVIEQTERDATNLRTQVARARMETQAARGPDKVPAQQRLAAVETRLQTVFNRAYNHPGIYGNYEYMQRLQRAFGGDYARFEQNAIAGASSPAPLAATAPSIASSSIAPFQRIPGPRDTPTLEQATWVLHIARMRAAAMTGTEPLVAMARNAPELQRIMFDPRLSAYLETLERQLGPNVSNSAIKTRYGSKWAENFVEEHKNDVQDAAYDPSILEAMAGLYRQIASVYAPGNSPLGQEGAQKELRQYFQIRTPDSEREGEMAGVSGRQMKGDPTAEALAIRTMEEAIRRGDMSMLQGFTTDQYRVSPALRKVMDKIPSAVRHQLALDAGDFDKPMPNRSSMSNTYASVDEYVHQMEMLAAIAPRINSFRNSPHLHEVLEHPDVDLRKRYQRGFRYLGQVQAKVDSQGFTTGAELERWGAQANVHVNGRPGYQPNQLRNRPEVMRQLNWQYRDMRSFIEALEAVDSSVPRRSHIADLYLRHFNTERAGEPFTDHPTQDIFYPQRDAEGRILSGPLGGQEIRQILATNPVSFSLEEMRNLARGSSAGNQLVSFLVNTLGLDLQGDQFVSPVPTTVNPALPLPHGVRISTGEYDPEAAGIPQYWLQTFARQQLGSGALDAWDYFRKHALEYAQSRSPDIQTIEDALRNEHGELHGYTNYLIRERPEFRTLFAKTFRQYREARGENARQARLEEISADLLRRANTEVLGTAGDIPDIQDTISQALVREIPEEGHFVLNAFQRAGLEETHPMLAHILAVAGKSTPESREDLDLDSGAFDQTLGGGTLHHTEYALRLMSGLGKLLNLSPTQSHMRYARRMFDAMRYGLLQDVGSNINDMESGGMSLKTYMARLRDQLFNRERVERRIAPIRGSPEARFSVSNFAAQEPMFSAMRDEVDSSKLIHSFLFGQGSARDRGRITQTIYGLGEALGAGAHLSGKGDRSSYNQFWRALGLPWATAYSRGKNTPHDIGERVKALQTTTQQFFQTGSLTRRMAYDLLTQGLGHSDEAAKQFLLGDKSLFRTTRRLNWATLPGFLDLAQSHYRPGQRVTVKDPSGEVRDVLMAPLVDWNQRHLLGYGNGQLTFNGQPVSNEMWRREFMPRFYGVLKGKLHIPSEQIARSPEELAAMRRGNLPGNIPHGIPFLGLSKRGVHLFYTGDIQGEMPEHFLPEFDFGAARNGDLVIGPGVQERISQARGLPAPARGLPTPLRTDLPSLDAVLQGLPTSKTGEDWQREFYEAVKSGDDDAVLKSFGRLQGRDPEMAAALAERFGRAVMTGAYPVNVHTSRWQRFMVSQMPDMRSADVLHEFAMPIPNGTPNYVPSPVVGSQTINPDETPFDRFLGMHTPEQRAMLEQIAQGGNFAINASPGVGKSTLMAHWVVGQMMADPSQRMTVLTQNNSAAGAFRYNLHKIADEIGYTLPKNVSTQTVHKLAYRVLRYSAQNGGTNTLPGGYKAFQDLLGAAAPYGSDRLHIIQGVPDFASNRFNSNYDLANDEHAMLHREWLIANQLHEMGVHVQGFTQGQPRPGQAYVSLNDLHTLSGQVDSFYQRNPSELQGFLQTGQQQMAALLGRVRNGVMPDTYGGLSPEAGLAIYNEAKRSNNLVDWNDVFMAAAHAIRTPGGGSLLTHPDILPHLVGVDETENFNGPQREFLGALSQTGAQMVIAGDPNQTIFHGNPTEYRDMLAQTFGIDSSRTASPRTNYRAQSYNQLAAYNAMIGAVDRLSGMTTPSMVPNPNGTNGALAASGGLNFAGGPRNQISMNRQMAHDALANIGLDPAAVIRASRSGQLTEKNWKQWYQAATGRDPDQISGHTGLLFQTNEHVSQFLHQAQQMGLPDWLFLRRNVSNLKAAASSASSRLHVSSVHASQGAEAEHILAQIGEGTGGWGQWSDDPLRQAMIRMVAVSRGMQTSRIYAPEQMLTAEQSQAIINGTQRHRIDANGNLMLHDPTTGQWRNVPRTPVDEHWQRVVDQISQQMRQHGQATNVPPDQTYQALERAGLTRFMSSKEQANYAASGAAAPINVQNLNVAAQQVTVTPVTPNPAATAAAAAAASMPAGGATPPLRAAPATRPLTTPTPPPRGGGGAPAPAPPPPAAAPVPFGPTGYGGPGAPGGPGDGAPGSPAGGGPAGGAPGGPAGGAPGGGGPPPTRRQRWANNVGNLGRNLARIGWEISFVSQSMLQSAQNELSISDQYRIPASQQAILSGTPINATSISPVQAIQSPFVQDKFNMFSAVQLQQAATDYVQSFGVRGNAASTYNLRSTNTPQGQLFNRILQTAAVGNMSPQDVMYYVSSAAGANAAANGGNAVANGNDALAALLNLSGGSPSAQQMQPIMSAYTQIAPLANYTGESTATPANLLGLAQAALGANPQMLGTAAQGLSSLYQAGINPNVSQQYGLLSVMSGQGPAWRSQVNQLMADVTQGKPVNATNLIGSMANSIAKTGLQAPDLASQLMSMLSKQGQIVQAGAQLQFNVPQLEINATNATIALDNAQLGAAATQLQYGWASYNYNLNRNNQLYGPIGADASRTAYFDFMRSSAAAGYDYTNADQAGTYKNVKAFGLKNLEFYAGVENQRQQLVLGRSKLTSDLAFQQQMKYLNEQENFYKQEIAIQNEDRRFQKNWQARLLESQGAVVGAQARLVHIQEALAKAQIPVLEWQAKVLPVQYKLMQEELTGQLNNLMGGGPNAGNYMGAQQLLQQFAQVYKGQSEDTIKQGLMTFTNDPAQAADLARMIIELQQHPGDINKFQNNPAFKNLDTYFKLAKKYQAYAGQHVGASASNAELNTSSDTGDVARLADAMTTLNGTISELNGLLKGKANTAGGPFGELGTGLAPWLMGGASILNIISLLMGGGLGGLGSSIMGGLGAAGGWLGGLGSGIAGGLGAALGGLGNLGGAIWGFGSGSTAGAVGGGVLGLLGGVLGTGELINLLSQVPGHGGNGWSNYVDWLKKLKDKPIQALGGDTDKKLIKNAVGPGRAKNIINWDQSSGNQIGDWISNAIKNLNPGQVSIDIGNFILNAWNSIDWSKIFNWNNIDWKKVFSGVQSPVADNLGGMFDNINPSQWVQGAQQWLQSALGHVNLNQWGQTLGKKIHDTIGHINFVKLLQNVWNGAGGLATSILKSAGSVNYLGWIGSVIGNLTNAIRHGNWGQIASSMGSALGSAIHNALSSKYWEGVFSNVGKALRDVFWNMRVPSIGDLGYDLTSWLLYYWNKFAGVIQNHLHVDWSVSPSKIIGYRPYATGGFTNGGWSLVGEQGPELARFPVGTHILSHPESMSQLQSSPSVTRHTTHTVNINVNGNTRTLSDDDIDTVLEKAFRILHDEFRS